MFAAIAAQLAVRAPLEWHWDAAWTLGLLLPAVADWSLGRFRPDFASNPWRTFTGALAGLALGRSLYIHFHRPFPPALQFQLMVVTGAVSAVILATYVRRTSR